MSKQCYTIEGNSNKVVIEKIIGYCNEIERMIDRFGNNFEAFNSDLAFKLAGGACIIQIGELTTRLTDDFKNQHSEIDWNSLKKASNEHLHDYENVKLDVDWQILTEDIPALKKSLQAILEVM